MKAKNFVKQRMKEKYENTIGKRDYEAIVREAEESPLPFEKAFQNEVRNYIMAVVM